MTKFYAVKVGKTPGIFFDWESCKAQVTGFTGAKYKSFTDINEALAFCQGVDSVVESEKGGKQEPSQPNNSENTLTKDGASVDYSKAVAYVDGSFDKNSNIVGSGVVFVCGDKTIDLKNATKSTDFTAFWNVAGELNAAIGAINFAIQNGVKELEIHHDYMGIGSWATGEWKAKNTLTQKYVKFINEVSDKIKLTFTKVKAHSGVELNERADRLAKAAIEEEKAKHRNI